LRAVRIVEWNCRSKFGAKLPALEALHPDVAVLAEAPLSNPRPDVTFTDRAISWCSVGQYSHKSLALAGFTSTLSEVETPVGTGHLSLAADHPAGFGILGIWSCPTPPRRYADEVIGSLDAYSEWIRSKPVVIAGDFNVPDSWANRVTSVEIGTHLQWIASGLSDHVPVVVDIDL
jgi:hypothetical protein